MTDNLRPFDSEHQDEVVEGLKDAGLAETNTSEQEVSRQRPVGVAVLAMLAFASAAWMMPFVTLTNRGTIPLALGATMAVTTALGVFSSMAMFMLKRWAVYLYAAVMILANAIFLLSGLWNPLVALIPAVVIAVGLWQLPRMD